MALTDLLDRDFDLRYRPAIGDTGRYRLDMQYRILDGQGQAMSLENYLGDFTRVVERVEPSGRVEESITWRNVRRRMKAPGAEEFDDAESLDWAEGFTYRFSAEDPHSAWSADYGSLPEDLLGWNFLLLTVDAHFEFDMVRSSRHGAIEKLCRLGDEVAAKDSDVPFDLLFPPVMEVPGFTKRGGWTRFAALTVIEREPCALLEFGIERSPFSSLMMGNEFQSSTSFAGTITQRLSDGSIEHGEFDEVVVGVGLPTVTPRYEITRIDQSPGGLVVRFPPEDGMMFSIESARQGPQLSEGEDHQKPAALSRTRVPHNQLATVEFGSGTDDGDRPHDRVYGR